MSSYQKVVYEGRLSHYQQYGKSFNKSKVQFEKDPFNAYQNFLYKRALFGLSVYGEEELSKMHWDKKKRILKVHERAQKVLNIWKQEIANKWSAQGLTEVFHHSTLIKNLVEIFANHVDADYISPLEFKQLGINKTQIINKLISEKVLPSNFYELNEAV